MRTGITNRYFRFISLHLQIIVVNLIVICFETLPASAESLISDLSSQDIRITSNFTGADIVLFGSIERDARTVSRAGQYDIVVTISGPRQTVVTRKKERYLGLWINRDSRTYDNVPKFYCYTSTVAINDIADIKILRKFEIGFDNLALMEPATGERLPHDSDEFKEALQRIRQKNKLYCPEPGEVTHLSRNLFRASIRLPATAPVGDYQVRIFLFIGGAFLDSQKRTIRVSKTGFEQQAHNLAHQIPLAYGGISVLLALLVGWLGGVLFRRS